MRTRKLLLITTTILTLLFHATLGHAQATPAQGLPPLPTTTAKPTSPLESELSTLEFNLLESSYIMTPDVGTRNRLVAAGEKSVNTFCIKGISPQYNPGNEDLALSCKKIAAKIVIYDKSNPAVACYENGADSQECSAAYAATELGVLNSHGAHEKDIEAYLASTQQSAYEIEGKLSSLKSLYNENHSPETYEEMLSLFYSTIPSLCTVTRYALVDTAPSLQVTPTPAPKPTTKPFEDLLKQLNNASPQETPTPTITRRRLVSNACYALIEELHAIAPQDALSLCTRYGSFSPQCLRAKKYARIKGKTGQTSIQTGPDALNPF